MELNLGLFDPTMAIEDPPMETVAESGARLFDEAEPAFIVMVDDDVELRSESEKTMAPADLIAAEEDASFLSAKSQLAVNEDIDITMLEQLMETLELAADPSDGEDHLSHLQGHRESASRVHDDVKT